MKFFKTIGKAVENAASFLGEKNRRAAYLNRIRAVIRCEEKAAEREYLALGRYYYNNLRDKSNPVTEAHCAEVEAIEGRLDKALNQLEQFYEMEKNASSVTAAEGEDGPTAICAKGSDVEEITLDGVECYDHDPMAEEKEPGAAPKEAAAETAAAEPGENDNLPFE